MENSTKYQELDQMDIMELEEVVKQSPWFSYARHLLLVRLHEMGDEIFTTQLKRCAVFLSSREALYNRINQKRLPKQVDVASPDTESFVSEIADSGLIYNDVEQPEKKRKVIVAGADFFSKEEFSQIPDEENMELKLKENKFYRETPQTAYNTENSIIGPDGKVNYNDLAFFTETLGHIYSQQGYYDQAIEVFSKLILLYPQKSAYFATLIRETEKYKDL